MHFAFIFGSLGTLPHTRILKLNQEIVDSKTTSINKSEVESSKVSSHTTMKILEGA